MNKEYFTFLFDWVLGLEFMTEKEQLAYLKGILNLAMDKTTIEELLKKNPLLARDFLRVDKDIKRGREISKIRSESGKRGGAKIGNQNAKKETEEQETEEQETEEQENEEQENEEQENEEQENEEKQEQVPKRISKSEIQEIVDFWNANKGDCVGCNKITPKLEKQIKDRLKSYSKEDLFKALENVHKDPFYEGKAQGSTWRANLLYVTRNDDNIEKFLSYQEPRQQQQQTSKNSTLNFIMNTLNQQENGKSIH